MDVDSIISTLDLDGRVLDERIIQRLDRLTLVQHIGTSTCGVTCTCDCCANRCETERETMIVQFV